MRKERQKKAQAQNPNRKNRIRIISWAAAIVSLALTTGALILPAMTMTGEDEIISDFAGEGADWIESSIVQDENTSALEGGPLFYDPEAEEETESELDPADSILLSEDETETETETETLTESAVWTETGAEAVTDENTVKPETEPDTAETEAETETETEAETGTDAAGTETETETETETDAAGTETETEAETETETETDTAETEAETGTETETDAAGTETEIEAETGADAAETERETDTDVDIVEPETEADSEEAETETEADFIEPGMATLPAAFPRRAPAAAGNAAGSILNSFSVNSDAANAWQIVDQAFGGNTPENKTSVGTDSYGAVRVQKNVIPTGTENEFYVYLSIDTKLLMKEYLQYAQYQATTSNNYHDWDLGTVVEAMTGNKKVGVSGDASSDYPNSALFTIQDNGGNVIAENVRLYWSQAENVTFYLKTSTGKYILMGIKVNEKDPTKPVRLSAEAEKYIYEDIMELVSLNSVTDTMGEYIEYLETVAGDYSTADPPSYSEDSRTLTWHPVRKDNPQEQTAQSGNTITTWSLNVAELVYKVRLNVQNDGFNSCASNMDSTVGENESYEVNRSASLSYRTNVGTRAESGTAAFQQPHVRGLLYDYAIRKVDEKGQPLDGAEFSFAGSGNGSAAVSYSLIGTSSGADGMVGWVHAAGSSKDEGTAADHPGVPWGTYTVAETKAPDGYEMDDAWKAGQHVTLCYTANADSLTASGTHMIYQNGNDPYVTVKNTKIPVTPVKIIKVDMTDQTKLLSGAEFSVAYTAADTRTSQSGEAKDSGQYSPTQDSGLGQNSLIQDSGSGQDSQLRNSDSGQDGLIQDSDSGQERRRSGSDSQRDMAANGTDSGPDSGTWTSGSGEDLGIIYSGSLLYGTYTLTESKAPDEYSSMSGTVTVTVAEDRVTYSQTDNGGGQTKTAPLQDPGRAASPDNPYVVTVCANPGVELPETGGSGRFPYTLGGAVFLTAAALMYGFRKRRGERRSDISL